MSRAVGDRKTEVDDTLTGINTIGYQGSITVWHLASLKDKTLINLRCSLLQFYPRVLSSSTVTVSLVSIKRIFSVKCKMVTWKEEPAASGWLVSASSSRFLFALASILKKKQWAPKRTRRILEEHRVLRGVLPRYLSLWAKKQIHIESLFIYVLQLKGRPHKLINLDSKGCRSKGAPARSAPRLSCSCSPPPIFGRPRWLATTLPLSLPKIWGRPDGFYATLRDASDLNSN